jgi:hypothetical protein
MEMICEESDAFPDIRSQGMPALARHREETALHFFAPML